MKLNIKKGKNKKQLSIQTQNDFETIFLIIFVAISVALIVIGICVVAILKH